MNEKLIIRNFGPIRSVELELGRFNVLIGEQATGKSTVAKVLAMCRYFSYLLTSTHPLDNPLLDGLIQWGLQESIKSDTFISYENDDYLFNAEAVERHWVDVDTIDSEEDVDIDFDFKPKLIAKSQDFQNLLIELDKLYSRSKPFQSSSGWIPTSFFQNDVARVMNNPFFIPTERGLQSIFSLGKSSIQNITDALFNQLARLDQIAQNFNADTLVEPLGITYKNFKGSGFIKKNNGDDFTSLKYAARGYQSTIPVVLVVMYYTKVKKKKKTFIVEEPEMNLFPAAQQQLVQFLADQVNAHGHSMLITTHSPYVLTSLNNLIEAYRAGQSHPDEVNKVIDKKHWLNADDVRVFMLHPDGTCEDIFDREGGLIKVEKIDDVSALLNDQFDNLLQLEFGEK